MKIRFSKMQGLGNDFMVIDGVRQSISLTSEQIQRLADRHFGVGFDQLLLVEPTSVPGVDFRYRIFNVDGSEVEQCGNGARCFVRFVHDSGLSDATRIRVETLRGIIEPSLEENGMVRVNMGSPRFSPQQIPFSSEAEDLIYFLDVADETLEVSVVSMGNPHAVQLVPDLDAAPVAEQGPLIERHERFPQRVNAGFMQVVDRNTIRLRVYERGSGETLACGTGACAAAVTGIRRGLLDSPVRVLTRGGELSIAWAGPDEAVWMTGPAVTVFTGEIEL